MKKTLGIGLVVSLLLLLVISGSGCMDSKNSSTHNAHHVIFYSQPDLDGTVTAISCNFGLAEIRIGDNASNKGIKGVVSFDISSIKYDVHIVDSAKLRIYQSGNGIIGSPYTELLEVNVENVSFETTFSAAIYNMPSKYTVDTPLSSAYSAGWKEVDVTGAVQYDCDQSYSHSQFRFHHNRANNTDNAADNDPWYMGEDPTYRPQLEIYYHD